MSNLFHSGANGHSPHRALKSAPGGPRGRRVSLKGSMHYSGAHRQPGLTSRDTSKIRSGTGRQRSLRTVHAPKTSLYMGKQTPPRTRGYKVRAVKTRGTVMTHNARVQSSARGIATAGGVTLLAGGTVGSAIAARHVARRIKARRVSRSGGGGFRQKRDSRGRFA